MVQQIGPASGQGVVTSSSKQTPSASLVRQPPLLLSNGFNVLNMKYDISETVEPLNVIALGVDPIGGDD